MITRRRFMQSALALSGAGALLGAYGFIVEPLYRLNVTRYRLTPPRWNPQNRLRIVALADFHFCRPWMDEKRVEEIVAAAMAEKPDMIVLLGDYLSTMKLKWEALPVDVWSRLLGVLRAPLGVHAILGNHDWWEDAEALKRKAGPTIAGRALEKAGISVYENDAVLLRKDNFSFWLTGLGDQTAFAPLDRRNPRNWRGIDDVPGMMAKITTDDPVISLIHEPDAFARMPERISLTLAGHTHGGQVRLFGRSFVVPSRYGRRYDYGHIVEENRHLIVSGGLGCSILPVRFGMPPEIVVVDLGYPRNDTDAA
ncbi:MAG: metallophosphoesterase [Beijerinckiaceae bacterium]